MTTAPSSRASAAPRQKWVLYPNVMWRSMCRVTSKRSGSGYSRSSRPAEPLSKAIFEPAGTVTP